MDRWHKMDWNDISQLQDHYYYLVTHKNYKTPMKAKWHSENGGCWEVLGCWGGDFHQFSDYDYSWDNHVVLAWMDLPDIYREEDEHDRTRKNDGVSCNADDQGSS